MTRKLNLAVLGAVLLIAACDGGSDGGGGGNAQGINSLGQAFVDAFNLRRNDTPVDAQSVNLVLTPDVQPFNP